MTKTEIRILTLIDQAGRYTIDYGYETGKPGTEPKRFGTRELRATQKLTEKGLITCVSENKTSCSTKYGTRQITEKTYRRK
jgi:hypothetical protein